MQSFVLKLPLILVQRSNLWLGSSSTLLRFPQPQGSVWYSSSSPTAHHWLFRYPSEAKTFAHRLKAYSLWFSRIFFLKFRMRGLGYRFRRITSSLFRFYFTKTNYIYFHCPSSIYLFSRKRKIILLSSNKHLLHLVFSHILRLHKSGPYNKRGFTFPRRVFRKKPGKKIL